MRQQLRRLLQPAITWLEAGADLPAVATQQQPEAIPGNAIGIQYPEIGDAGITREDLTRIVLTDLLKVPLQYFKVLESYGRIDLVAYQPYAHYDPVLPVPLVNMGTAFTTEYRKMALELSAWVSDMFRLTKLWDEWITYTGYAHRMPPKPRPVPLPLYHGTMVFHMERALKIAQASNQLSGDEFYYFDSQLRLSIAQPDRFTQYDNEVWQKRWRRARSINVNLTQG